MPDEQIDQQTVEETPVAAPQIVVNLSSAAPVETGEAPVEYKDGEVVPPTPEAAPAAASEAAPEAAAPAAPEGI